MTPTLPYWHVDAFAERAFSGNQAAVILLEAWLPDEVMLAIAAENMFAETAFVVRGAGDGFNWQLRWFSPSVEVALCGHATLAAGHVLLAREEAAEVQFVTRRAGQLTVRRAPVGYELALPALHTAPGGPLGPGAALGAEPLEVRSHPDGYGLYRFASENEIRALRPDAVALAAEGAFMAICTAPGIETDVVSRVFVPGAGIDEDSVTGSAHAVLAPYWCERLGRSNFTAFQASSRGGHLTCRLEGDQAWLGGGCVTVVEGRFHLPG
jgi:predicted PhzF superfamily epimerase YddE/YHI9